MDTKAPNLIPSGIEPVDKLLGGLASGQLYLVHGEGAGKSLFGIRFLIEGLKRGEHGALVIRYSPEDAVRRFARLGYDCLEDVYSGRLVILEYSDDIIQQVSRLREMTPVLRELEWLLGETKPQRLIFDPLASLIAGVGNLQSRVSEFTAWARSFGATVVFIANGEADIVDAVKPQTAEVFRFEVKDVGERAARFVTFEKSGIADQAIEVDPSRGIFLLDRGRGPEHFFSIFQAAPPESGEASPLETPAPAVAEGAATTAETNPAEPSAEPATLGKISDFDLDRLLEPFAEMARANTPPSTTDAAATLPPAASTSSADSPAELRPPARPSDVAKITKPDHEPQAPLATQPLPRLAPPTTPPQPPALESSPDVFADLIDELAQSASPLDIELPELPATPATGEPPAPTAPASRESQTTGDLVEQMLASPVADPPTPATAAPAADAPVEAPTPHRRAADVKIESALAARATEVLLRPPDQPTAAPDQPPAPEPAHAALEPPSADAPGAIQPQDCKVLVIDDDPASCALVAQTLESYTLEIVHDGMSGLARLISLKPDLVVLSLDLPIIDGFKVLEHIRQGLNVPVILTTETRMRAGDRVLATELGADYYLAKPYSPNELRHKSRQLIARYRGIDSWITGALASGKPAEVAAPAAEPTASAEHFTSYQKFTAQVEERVRATLESNATFAIVGCRIPQMTARGGHIALRLYDHVRRLIRETDLLSTNPRNDIVILLTDANANGARAFVSRLRERIVNEMHQEPDIWLRTFPDLEEARSAKDWSYRSSNGSGASRRATDRAASEPAQDESSEAPTPSDSRPSYLDFLEQM
jgi:DNA-binding response OmpR family regulator/KaiC/GvpD/RAD55 family RecA-like ATPase